MMSVYYVEPQAYCNDYVEGDLDSLSIVLDELDDLEQNAQSVSLFLVDLSSRLESLENAVNTMNNNLIGGSFVTSVNDSLQSLLTNFMTKQDLLDKIPMVDDKSLMIYQNGTIVLNSLIDGFFTVESSRFLPVDNNQYTVVYTVSKEIDGVKHYSDFAADYLKEANPEEWILKTDCEDTN